MYIVLVWNSFDKVSVWLKAELDEASEALDAAQRLSEQLDRKEAMISALRDEGVIAATIVSVHSQTACL